MAGRKDEKNNVSQKSVDERGKDPKHEISSRPGDGRLSEELIDREISDLTMEGGHSVSEEDVRAAFKPEDDEKSK